MTVPDAPTPVLPYAGVAIDRMPSVVLGFVAFRALGIWAAMNLCTSFAENARFWLRPGISKSGFIIAMVASLLPPFVWGLAAVVSLTYARPLSRRLFAVPVRLGAMPSVDALIGVVTAGIGLWLLVTSAIDLIWLTFTCVYESQNGPSMRPGSVPGDWVVPLVRICAGAVLFLRPGLVIWIWRTQSKMPQ